MQLLYSKQKKNTLEIVVDRRSVNEVMYSLDKL